VDNHTLLRQALTAYLCAELPTARVGQAASGAAALAQLRAVRWDVLLLDLLLGDLSGFHVLQVVQRSFPELPVVMVSLHTPGPMSPRMNPLPSCSRLFMSSNPRAACSRGSANSRVAVRDIGSPAGHDQQDQLLAQ
jgi:hypothetical protein